MMNLCMNCIFIDMLFLFVHCFPLHIGGGCYVAISWIQVIGLTHKILHQQIAATT